MLKLAINGINGKMGHVLANDIENDKNSILVCGFDLEKKDDINCDVYTNYDDCNDEIDVIIDFSHPSQLEKLVNYCIKRNIPVVVATTGLTDEQKGFLKKSSEKIPVFFTANMSLGVNLLVELVNQAAKVLYPDFDIEIIEKHHNQKIDAPSGTALMIADEINETLDNSMAYMYDRHSVRKKRDKNEIGIHAVRGGTIVGEHEVLFAGNDERISITHQATSKQIFATGAIRAAEFLKDKENGMYSMKDVLVF